jgi:hypothetical protein
MSFIACFDFLILTLTVHLNKNVLKIYFVLYI